MALQQTVKLLFLALFVTSLFATPHKKEKYVTATECKTCHLPIVKAWSSSWHAKSHYKHDEYLRKSIDYVAKKTRLGKTVIKAKCAKCHNPKLKASHVDDTIAMVETLGFKTELDDALNDVKLSEGINCLVCHNIEKIHTKAPQNIRGMDRVQWSTTGVMTGPYKDAKSPYHKTEYRSFFTKNVNELCFVCHANDTSFVKKDLYFTNMQKEYKGDQKCVDCHMSKPKKGFAATLRIDHGKIKKRVVREHKFWGAHKEQMLKNALKLSLKKSKSSVLITIKNPQPHNIPSGFGGRELLVEIKYYKGTKRVDTKTVALTTTYKRKRGRVGIPHLALSQSEDLSIPAKGQKVLKVKYPKDVTSLKVTIYYRLVNSEIKTLLDLKEPIWSKKFFIASKSIKL